MTHESPKNKTLPRVGIVIPTLNEAEHIERLIRKIQIGADKCSIYVVDGGSTDGTQQLVKHLIKKHPNITLVHNPDRIQSAAVNLAVLSPDFDHEYFVRVDAHCDYPENFASLVTECLIKTGADSVVVPMRTVHNRFSGFQKAAAAAQNSILGNGGAAHRNPFEGYHPVDHGHHAGFKTATFKKLGGYDTTFRTNEDAEYDTRLKKEFGGKILLNGNATIDYFPRTNLDSLAKQYYAYGEGRAQTVKKHRIRPALRQLAPAVVTAGIFGSVLTWPIFALLGLTTLKFLAAIAPLSYAITCLAVGWRISHKSSDGFETKERFYVGLAAMTMHLNWGTGFLKEFLFGRKFTKQN